MHKELKDTKELLMEELKDLKKEYRKNPTGKLLAYMTEIINACYKLCKMEKMHKEHEDHESEEMTREKRGIWGD